MRDIEGSHDGTGLRFSIVVSRFNAVVTDELISGAVDMLMAHGVDHEAIQVVRVPGAWELPATCAQVARRGGVDGILALGCVIRGETPHFEYVAGEASRGLGELAREVSIPIVFGVLTTEDLEQAMERVGGNHGNKGEEAALTAIEMVHVYRALS